MDKNYLYINSHLILLFLTNVACIRNNHSYIYLKHLKPLNDTNKSLYCHVDTSMLCLTGDFAKEKILKKI